jgi:hypothetical protein
MPSNLMDYQLTRPKAQAAYEVPVGAPPGIPSPTSAGDGNISRTSTHHLSSVMFLLSENYEQVFSKFNFPEPTTSNKKGRSNSAQAPFRGLDDDFVNSVLEFDFFSLPSCGPSTRCASVEPQGADDAANVFSTAAETEGLLRRVMTAPSLLALRDVERTEVQQQLQNLCRPARVSRFVAHYFDMWHRNCRIVHRPSFGLSTCHEPLVLAVVFLGAMYSSNPAERTIAINQQRPANFKHHHIRFTDCPQSMVQRVDEAPRNGSVQERMGRYGILQERRPICVCYAAAVVVEGEAAS